MVPYTDDGWYFSPHNEGVHEVYALVVELRPVDAENAAPPRAPAILEFSGESLGTEKLSTSEQYQLRLNFEKAQLYQSIERCKVIPRIRIICF